MHKPSYNEVVYGWGYQTHNFAASVIAANTAAYTYGNTQYSPQVFLVAGSAVHSSTFFQTSDITLGAKCAIGVGVHMPLDVTQREFYTFAGAAYGYATAAGVNVVPFVGHLTAPLVAGGYNTVQMRNLLGFDFHISSTGLAASWSRTLRPAVQPDTVDPTLSGVVFGALYVNPTGSALSVSGSRLSIDCVRFAEPDLVDVAGI